MNVGFVGHYYHQKTGSSRFMLDIISEYGGPPTIYLDPSDPNEEPGDYGRMLEAGHDRIIVWQSEKAALALAKRDASKVVFIPMYDGAKHLSKQQWLQLSGVTIISFSRTLHEYLRELGLNSYYFQFFLNPADFNQQSDFVGLRAFLWQRRELPDINTAATLLGRQSVTSFHLHMAPDPGVSIAPVDPTLASRLNLRTSTWFSEPYQLHEILDKSNLYFSPRYDEGIGMSFLEAMARGHCVVSANSPTMSEYMTNEVSGILYDPSSISPVEFCNAKLIGEAARRRAWNGHKVWAADRSDRLPELLFRRVSRGSSRELDGLHHLPSRGDIRRQAFSHPSPPRLTVAVTVLNAESSFDMTVDSIVEQDFESFEIVVVDGGSTDNTLEKINKRRSSFSSVISEKDNGIYDAMNKAVNLAKGEYILFMNAGDSFLDSTSLSRAMEPASNADFIVGHHIYVTSNDQGRFHRCADFNVTWRRIYEGDLSNQWLSEVPCHQSTFTKVSLLRGAGGYDLSFKIAADHAFMYKMKSEGATFFNCDECISIMYGGGTSWQKRELCYDEWWRIARTYGPKRAVDVFFRKYIINELGILAYYKGVIKKKAGKAVSWIMNSRGLKT